MKQQRLEQLADGIFSIVMTLLVLDIKLPIGKADSDLELGILFHQLIPSFSSFFSYTTCVSNPAWSAPGTIRTRLP